VVTARLLHHLVDDKLRVTAHVEALDTKFDGDAEATEEGLILRHVIGRWKVEANHVAHVHSEGRDEKETGASAGFHHRPIEVHCPTLSLNLRWGQLNVRLLSDEFS